MTNEANPNRRAVATEAHMATTNLSTSSLFSQSDLAHAGERASHGLVIARRLVGECSRFAISLMATRFGEATVMVADADVTDEVTGLPAIVWQGSPAEFDARLAACTRASPPDEPRGTGETGASRSR